MTNLKSQLAEVLRLMREDFPIAADERLEEIVAGLPDEPTGWQPIETAPKDGTDILVAFDCATVWIAHIAWYRDGGIENGVKGPDDIGWWSYTRGSVTQEKLNDYRTPTHWMPLPALRT